MPLHSTLVLLKVKNKNHPSCLIEYFTFYFSSIKGPINVIDKPDSPIDFTFYFSSIKGMVSGGCKCHKGALHSTLVLLKANG